VFNTFTVVCIFCCYLLLLVYLMLCCSISPSNSVFFLLPHLQLNLDTLLLLFLNSIYYIDLGPCIDLNPLLFCSLSFTFHLSPFTFHMFTQRSPCSPAQFMFTMAHLFLPLACFMQLAFDFTALAWKTREQAILHVELALTSLPPTLLILFCLELCDGSKSLQYGFVTINKADGVDKWNDAWQPPDDGCRYRGLERRLRF
jgi:hypothetical protein